MIARAYACVYIMSEPCETIERASMFEYEFYDAKHDTGSVPSVFSKVPEDFISLEQVLSLRPTFWGEHCVECAMPLCFGTCVRYEARPDGKCKRFKFGIKDNEDPAFEHFLNHAEIAFRPWGKLESPVYPGTASVEAVIRQNDRYRVRALDAVSRESEDSGSVGPEGYSRLFSEGYIGGVDAVSDDDLGKDTEFFVFQAYSYNEESFDLSFEVTTLQRLVHRRSLRIEPGFNQHVLPLRIGTQPFRKLAESRDQLLARIIPQNDFEAHIVVLMAEFANLEPDVAARFAEDENAMPGETRECADGRLSDAKRRSIPPQPADKVKCVCWDLDNTVWAGTLIETDPELLELRPGVLSAIEELDRRGIVQMVVSKNQEDDALPVLKRLGINDFFVYRFINWNAKSDSIARIADLLNINIDTFAFVDDQPFERAEVGESLPCVRVYAETDVPSLLDDPAFDVPVTADGSKRRIMYQTEAKRREVEQGFSGSNVDFIRSCGLVVEMSLPDTEAKRVRSYELVQRTNQLNLSGRRYEADAFAALIAGEQGDRTVCVTCEDRFGSYGQVGYVVLELCQSVLYVREFAMSCRVMGKCVENALASWLMELARARGADQVVMKGRRTDRNALVVKTFEGVGFGDEALFDGDIVLSLPTDRHIVHDDVVRVIDGATERLSVDALSGSDPSEEAPAVLAFVPHQDDEVLTLGAGLAEAVRRTGGRVAVVLCTDGKNCGTRLRLNDGSSCPGLGDDHRYDFDVATYGKLRDVEFVESCKSLGISERAVLLAHPRMVDGRLTVGESRKLIERYLRLYPDATVFTHAFIEPASDPRILQDIESLQEDFAEEHVVIRPDGSAEWASQHSDHRLLARAALDLFEAGTLASLQFFVEFYHMRQFRALNPTVRMVEHIAVGESAERLRAAVEEYGVWDPDRRRFALGLHSAQRELAYLRDHLVGYSYFPSRGEGDDGSERAEHRAMAAQRSAIEGVADELALLRDQVRTLREELDRARIDLEEERSSTTHRVGRVVMALPCAVKDRLRKS